MTNRREHRRGLCGDTVERVTAALVGVVRGALRRVSSAVGWVLVGLVRVYQLVVSPLLGPRCRFYPSCSSYAIQAVRRHGPVRGAGLAAWRLLRCNPWNPGGIDPVPPRDRSGSRSGAEHKHHLNVGRGA